MHYNLLMFGNNTGDCNQNTNNYIEKTGYLKTIVDYVKPDILTVNEINESFLYHDYILNNALNVNGTDYYQRGNPPNYSNSYIINQIFYNSEKLSLISNLAIETNYRDIDIFKLKINSPGTPEQINLNCVVAHLKAGNLVEDEAERANETSKLMNYLNNTSATANYTMSGDFNVYSASEQAFQNLLFPSNEEIRFYDPVNQIGAWNNNPYFAPVHTQSTHTSGDCFSPGGLDDRFDFILASDEIINGSNFVKFLPGTYNALGQDGNHFDKSLTSNPLNSSIPEDVLYSLYNMSDHLPVVMKLIAGDNLGINSLNENDYSIQIQNPVQHNVLLSISAKTRVVLLIRISSLDGRLLFSDFKSVDETTTEIEIPFETCQTGLYFMQIVESKKLISAFKIIKK